MKITKTDNPQAVSFEAVELREPLVDDFLKAERIAGSTDGIGFVVCMLSQTGTFDGKKLPPEGLHGMSGDDFLELSNTLNLQGAATSRKEPSTSSGKDDSTGPPSGK